MVRSCAAYGCSNRYSKDGSKSFHKFPLKNQELFKKWVVALKRESFTPTEHTVICSDHFLPSDYYFCQDDKDFSKINHKPILKQDAVPSLFSFNTVKHKRKAPLKRTSPSSTMSFYVKRKKLEDVSSPSELKENAPPPRLQEDVDINDVPSTSRTAVSPTKTLLRKKIKTLQQKLVCDSSQINWFCSKDYRLHNLQNFSCFSPFD